MSIDLKPCTDGGPAFPYSVHMEGYDRVVAGGMSLRDYFASAAMAAMMSGDWETDSNKGALKDISETAYQFADAMLKAREQ